jgi:hypothetical protein
VARSLARTTESYRVATGKEFRLARFDSRDTDGLDFSKKRAAETVVAGLEKLVDFQARLCPAGVGDSERHGLSDAAAVAAIQGPGTSIDVILSGFRIFCPAIHSSADSTRSRPSSPPRTRPSARRVAER